MPYACVFPPDRLVQCLAVAFLLVFPRVTPAAAATVATTTVTTYEYDADGAPTAITTQVDGGAASTVYLSWDNFVPDANDPTSGTVGAGNGNLATAGTSPSAASATYSFDRRDRLVGYSAGGQELTYTYHADGTMASSTTADGDGFLFYYDRGGLPQMTNMRQQSDGLWSAHLGPLRHVSDGSEQILMAPRKDTSGEYDASSESLSAYRYDAFGACTCAGTCTCADASGEYDIHDNPFRYAGEYRDAIWQGQYLRARWYDSQVPTFVSRDPLAHLNRYGYGDANPVMMVDPSGMKSISNAIASGFDKAVDWLNSGVQGHFARLFLSPVLYPLEIVAHPGQFWNQLKRDPVQIAFIGVSAVAGVGGKLVGGASLAALEAQQTGIGVVQSVFSGFGDFRGSGHEHFDATAFVDGLESAVGASLTHAVLGIGAKNPFKDKIADVEEARAAFQGNARDGEALIYRVREGTVHKGWTSPAAERLKLGFYHEVLVAITSDAVHVTEFYGGILGAEFVNATVADALEALPRWNPIEGEEMDFGVERSRFRKVGKINDFDPDVFHSNPTNLRYLGEDPAQLQAGQRARYRTFWRNCHTHAAAVLSRLRLRD